MRSNAVGPRIAGAARAQELDPADHLVERPGTERGQQPAHVLGHEQEVRRHALGGAGEVGPQVRTLGGHARLAGVAVAGPQHDAALGDHGRGAERVLVRSEQGRHHDLAPGLEAAVDPEPHPAAQVVGHQGLLRVGQAQLPRHAGVLDRRQRAGAGASVRSAEVDHVGQRLDDAGRDGADPAGGHQLHRHLGRVDLLEVVDQLGQVLDRVDVVVRGRRDQPDAGLGVAQPGDLARHLVARELAALARLRALGHLDLDLVGEGEVLRRHTEAARTRPA